MSEAALQTEYAVVARSSRPGPLPFVLKDGETFAVFDAQGDIRPEAGDLGVFHEGTRHLSRLEMRLWGKRAVLLSSTVREDNCMLVAHLTNPDLTDAQAPTPRLAKGDVYILRSSLLSEASLAQELAITNFTESCVCVEVWLGFDADFRDIFEVRGTKRSDRGTTTRSLRDGVVRLVYHGLDGKDRLCALRVGKSQWKLDERSAACEVRVDPRQTVRLGVSVDFGERGNVEPSDRFAEGVRRNSERFDAARRRAATIQTSDERFDQWTERSFSDVHMLATRTAEGEYPYGGVPWYSTPFGRDGIITARQMLAIEPAMARGVLAFLSSHQATEVDPERDAEPGKILHEFRQCEMANLGEVPFGRYYGSIDSTPLFVMLAGDYLRRTNDLEFVEKIWPNLRAALEWIDGYGDRDGDGFVEYARAGEKGLRNQGWKDSEDSISHADGRLAEGPIALCEVQGYVYAALLAMASIAGALGREEEARDCRDRAGRLRDAFNERFWLPDLGTYALALDGEKRPCRVRASNAGHCLWCGIAPREHASAVAETLLGSTSFSGWGVRTLDERERRYNPLSYHNGSVWPHDNSLIALGLARYGFKRLAARLTSGMFDASNFMAMHRLPELFCGLERRSDEGPTLYPVACMPQAWASGSVFALLEAMLGLDLMVDARTKRPAVHLADPVLPPELRHVQINGLRVGDEEVDLEFHRYEFDVGVQTRRSSRVDVVITK